MTKLANDIAKGAGNSIVTNQAATVEVHQLGHDMDKLLEQRDKNYREIIRQLQVPIILFDPDILNRATSQELMEAWTVSVLKIYRSWFKDIVQDQWINPIIKSLIENERNAARETDTGIDIQTPETEADIQDNSKQTPFDNESETDVTPAITREVIPIEAIDPATGEVIPYRLPWKLKIELEPLNYDTFKERAEMSILLKNNGLATTGTALKRIGVTDENELAQLLEMEQERRVQNQQFVGAEVAQEQQQQVAGNANQPVGQQQQQPPQGPSKSRSVERQREKFKQSLRDSVTGNNQGINAGERPKRIGINRRGTRV